MTTVPTGNKTDHSAALFNKAQNYMPGGVNSPVRAYRAVGGVPRFIKTAHGAYVTDVDDNHYIDYIGSWGPMILGHAHSAVIQAVQETIEHGLSFGAPCEKEVLLAKICEFMPAVEKVRMVNSGTEATMSALRLARGATGRTKIIKFEGCYHGHADYLLVKAGSGALTFGHPSSPGVPPGIVQDTLTATFNNLDSVSALFEKYPDAIAAIIVEPIAGNMNMVPASPEFLSGLRELCDAHGSLLIFDEVITGFRVARGGAQSLYNVTPDLTTLGKIIGGGMPVGAYGGRQAIMEQLSPEGSVYQAGTLSGNPVAMAAGLATLKELAHENFYADLKAKTEQLVIGILSCAKNANISLSVNFSCGIFGLFFTDAEKITQYQQVMAADTERFKRFFHILLNKGIYLAPSAFESSFISAAHRDKEINKTLELIEQAFVLLNN